MQENFLGNDLTQIEKDLWQLLQEATTSYKAVFHYGTVANIQDGRAALRTVILRHADPVEKKLFFHTDFRSPKVEALKKDPAISWLFYDEQMKLQLRMTAEARIHYQNAVTEDTWQKLKTSSQLTYSIADAPGQHLEETKALPGKENWPELLHFAKNNFAVVETKILSIDFLYLHHAGNRRAVFNCVDHTSHWLQA